MSSRGSVSCKLEELRGGGGVSGVERFISDRYFDRLVAAVRRRCPAGGRAGPEDAANEALRVLFEGLRKGDLQFRSRGPLWTVLRTVAVWRAINSRRGERKVKCVADLPEEAPGGDDSTVAYEGVLGRIPSREPPPDWPLVERETRQLLFNDLLKSEEDRRIALGKFQDGASNKEIARRLGCSEEKVRKRVGVFLRRLARELEDG
jgi:RNA polymerase sigma factor (sigma-70 family)